MDQKQKVKIIFDTDIGGDCDDAGALAMLHRLCDLGEAQLVAVTASYASPFVAGCIDAVNTYFGRKVPVGVCYDRTDKGAWIYGGALCKEFPNEYPESSFGEANGTPDAVKLIRKVLSQAEDHSITFVVTGSMTTAAGLVCSTPDEFSPLFGKELISRKISRTVVMGGSFYGEHPSSDYLERGGKDYAEWNILEDIASARIMCEEWPGEMVFSGFEIGLWCVTMKEYVEKAPADSPVRRAYELHPFGKNGRASWDHTAMLEAVRPGKYWYYHPWGQVCVNEEGVTRWYTKEGGKMSFLIPKVDYETLRQTIDNLVMEKHMCDTVEETVKKVERHFGFVKNDFSMDALEIKKVEKGTELANELLYFVENFSWEEVKEHVSWMVRTWVYNDWETPFVAIVNGQIVGMVSIMKTDYYPLPEIYPWVSCLFVSEDYRGYRISEKLIDFANAYAKENGFDKTYIPSEHVGLYEKYGYHYVKDIVNYGTGTDRLYVKEMN